MNDLEFQVKTFYVLSVTATSNSISHSNPSQSHYSLFSAGQDLVSEPTSQGAEADEEAGRAPAEGEAGESPVPRAHRHPRAAHAPHARARLLRPTPAHVEAPHDGREAGLGAGLTRVCLLLEPVTCTRLLTETSTRDP